MSTPELLSIIGTLITYIPSIAIIIVVVVFIKKSKKKKEQDALIRNNLYEWSKKDLPPMYFERLFMTWHKSDEPINEKMASIKKAYHELIDNLDEFESLLDQLNRWSLSGWRGLSFSLQSQEDIDQYHQMRSEDDFCLEMRTLFPLYARLKRDWDSFMDIAKLEKAVILPHEDLLYRGFVFEPEEKGYYQKNYDSSFDFAKTAYLTAVQEKWKRLCTRYPQLNNDACRKKYVDLTAEDEAVWKSWKTFYIKSFLDIRESLGLEKWSDRMNAFLAKRKEYEPLFSCIRSGVSEYSSIYEIDDFSYEEATRIAELYKNGTMHGFYRKANDPKYSSNSQ